MQLLQQFPIAEVFVQPSTLDVVATVSVPTEKGNVRGCRLLYGQELISVSSRCRVCGGFRN